MGLDVGMSAAWVELGEKCPDRGVLVRAQRVQLFGGEWGRDDSKKSVCGKV